MPVLICMLRGVNLGAHNRVKMDALRTLCESLKLEDPRTYVQSGNVIFRTKEKNSAVLGKKIQDAIAQKFKFRPDLEPGKILVTFLAAEPGPDARTSLAKFKDYPEEIHLTGREMYIYFPNGAGKSKLPWSSVEKLLKTTGTARNWNSVTKMLEIAEELEAAG